MQSDDTVKKGDILIETKDIVKNYGYLQALRGANIQIRAGEVVALIGDNGAGKSTLANILCGAIPKTSGHLYVRGKEVENQTIANAQEAGIQVVYQDLSLGADLNVPENIFMGREIIKKGFFGRLFQLVDTKAMTEKSKAQLAKLGIGLKSMTVPVSNLSGGERQALAVAKAATWATTVLIMDEPTAALGARQSALVYSTMRSAADQNLGVLVISHDIPKMLEKADRIAIMRQGLVIADLKTEETNLQQVLSLMLTGEG